MENDKIIIFTEDIKKDPNFIKELLISQFNLNEVDIHYNRSDKMNEFSDIIVEKDSCSIYIKYIENTVYNFINNYIKDEYSDGLSIAKFYLPEIDIEFAQEFICIDLDHRDKIKGDKSKLEFLIAANEIVSKIDNTFLLIASTMTESIIDPNLVYTGKTSDYKNYISKNYSSEQNKLMKNIEHYITVNNNKFEGILIDEYNNHIFQKCENVEASIPVRHQIGKLISELKI